MVKMLKPRLAILNPSRVRMLSTAIVRMRGRGGREQARSVLQDCPMCALCADKGLVAVSTQADHRIPLADGGADDPSNMWGLCDECHTWKTGQEAALRAQGLPGILADLPSVPPKPGPVFA